MPRSQLRNQTSALSADAFVSRGRHYLTYGGVRRWQQFNLLSQQDARGTFTFTGAAAGNDFAGFLLGVPDTSSIAFGNADKYLRATINEAFVNDDWRVNPAHRQLGLRWEYWSPVTEVAAVESRHRAGFFGRGSGDRRPVTIQRFAAPGPEQLRAANRIFLAAVPRVVDGGARRLRSLLRHLGVPVDRDADGAAGAAVEEPERPELSRKPADAGQRIHSAGNHQPTTFAVDPTFPRRLFAELAALRFSATCPQRCR